MIMEMIVIIFMTTVTILEITMSVTWIIGKTIMRNIIMKIVLSSKMNGFVKEIQTSTETMMIMTNTAAMTMTNMAAMTIQHYLTELLELKTQRMQGITADLLPMIHTC